MTLYLPCKNNKIGKKRKASPQQYAETANIRGRTAVVTAVHIKTIRNKMKKSYLKPKVEGIVVITENLIAASAPQARNGGTREYENPTSPRINDWGNIWSD
jgi:hypothetical protein